MPRECLLRARWGKHTATPLDVKDMEPIHYLYRVSGYFRSTLKHRYRNNT